MYFISECTLFRNRIKYIFKSLHFGNFINSGIKWVTRIPKAVIRKRVNVSGMYFGYVLPKMENVYLYTITEFTHLFVDIKHMRPVTEMPVVDRTFQF